MKIECPDCNGAGFTYEEAADFLEAMYPCKEQCELCKGEGRIDAEHYRYVMGDDAYQEKLREHQANAPTLMALNIQCSYCGGLYNAMLGHCPRDECLEKQFDLFINQLPDKVDGITCFRCMRGWQVSVTQAGRNSWSIEIGHDPRALLSKILLRLT